MIPLRQVRSVVYLCGWLLASLLFTLHVTEDSSIRDSQNQRHGPHLECGKPRWESGTSEDASRLTGPPQVVSTSPPVPPPPSMVILVTYMRSGSSLVGDVIQQHPEVYYMFEPLHAIYSLRKGNYPFSLLHFETRPSLFEDVSIKNLSSAIIENVLTCQAQKLDLSTLLSSRFQGLSKSQRRFASCIHSAGVLDAYNRCLPELMKRCSSSKLSLVKTIRFSMENAGALMQSQPSLKVIHLLRDPRATLLSQSMVGNLAWEELRNASRRFCQRVSKDLQVARRLASLHPGRLLTLRYDDLAQRPLPAVEALYRFLGLEFDAPRRQYVQDITQSGRPDNCAICTTRANSTATALRWRERMDHFRSVELIQRECGSVFQKLGYLPVSEMTLRDLTVPTMTRRLPPQ